MSPLNKIPTYKRFIRKFSSENIKNIHHSIYSTVKFDIDQLTLDININFNNNYKSSIDIKTITWFIPEFNHVYYGGIYTILRFADDLHRNHNVENRFIIISNNSATYFKDVIKNVFPALENSFFKSITSLDDIDLIPESDVCIATLWNTAYYAAYFNKVRRKFYFIQDFEPSFYTAGTISAQAEATYRFGFYGIINTQGLYEIHTSRYMSHSTYFNPCVDTSLFFPAENKKREKPYTVFFYARPTHPRNGFELGAVALAKVKKALGEDVHIISAGEQWNPQDYGLDGIVTNIGLLPYEKTAEIYRQCDIGLSMMFTYHPSYLPFEMMASKCLVISNINHATTWFLKDKENCVLSLPSASCISSAIINSLQDYNLREEITNQALQTIKSDHSNWTTQIENVYQFMRLGPP